MKIREILCWSVLSIVSLATCSSSDSDPAEKSDDTKELLGSQFVADYVVAREEVLRAIPIEFIDKARQNLHIAY